MAPRPGDRWRNKKNAGDEHGFISSFIHSFIVTHSFPQRTLIEGLPKARQLSKHWDPAMSKADKIPAPKELYLRDCSTKGMEEREDEQKQINHTSPLKVLTKKDPG